VKNTDPAAQAALPASPADHPLLVGLRAAKANFIPGLIIQAAMIALVLAYHYSEPTRLWMERLETIKGEWGYLFSFLLGAVAGGILPELLLLGLTQRWRVRRENLNNAGFHILLWGGESVIVDAFYRLQGHLFGTQADFSTVLLKMVVDQFIYCVVFATPFCIFIYEWRNQGYRLAGLSRVLTPRFYAQKVFPSLIANWGVWIPLVCVIYSMPPQLQIPLFGLALTFWVILFAWINRPKP
jgi:hypothetical protein